LKGYQLATEPTLDKTLFTSRWFLIAQVEFELFLGVFLLSGLYKRPVWLVTLVCFIGFSCVTLYKGLSGQASCGCFGKMEVSPWYTLIFDVLASGALLVWRPKIAHPLDSAGLSVVRSHWRRLSFPAAAILLICLYGGYAMASFEPVKISDSGMIEGEGNLVVLEPEKWVGKPFPLIKYIDIGEKLKTGRWVVVLYHYDCSTCKEVIEKFRHIIQLTPAQSRSVALALIEVPPCDAGNVPGNYAYGQLSHTISWFIQTPLTLLLDGGIVQKEVAGDQKLDKVREILVGL